MPGLTEEERALPLLRGADKLTAQLHPSTGRSWAKAPAETGKSRLGLGEVNAEGAPSALPDL